MANPIENPVTQGPKTFIKGFSGNIADVDSTGHLLTTGGGGGGGNDSVSPVGSAVPADATAIGWKDGSGNLQLVSAATPLPISGSISATNPSVSATGAAVPASATAIGWKDGSGNLQDVSAANPLPISGSISATNPSVGTSGSAIPTSATLLGVKDGSGNLQPVGSANPVRTDPTGTTVQPVSATSLPLPTGAATAAKQPAIGTAGSASADVITVQGIASGTPQPVSGIVTVGAGSAVIGHVIADSGSTTAVTSLPATPAGTNLIGKVGIDQTTPGTTNKVSIGTDGTVAINAAIPAGTNLIGKTGIDQTTPGTTNKVSIGTDGVIASITATVPTKVVPGTSGGMTLPFSGSVGATVTAVKTSAGQIYGWQILNNTAAIAYVQVFNKATGSVTVGTTVADFVIPIPASSGATIEISNGIAFSTAISIACTTTRTGSSAATCDVLMMIQ